MVEAGPDGGTGPARQLTCGVRRADRQCRDPGGHVRVDDPAPITIQRVSAAAGEEHRPPRL